jgi:hypothetical protein
LLLRLLFTANLIVTAHRANQAASNSSDCSALAGISGDGTAGCAGCSADPGASQQPSLLSLASGRRSRGPRPGRWIKPSLLGRPSAALPFIGFLFLGALALAWINEEIVSLSNAWRQGDCQTQEHCTGCQRFNHVGVSHHAADAVSLFHGVLSYFDSKRQDERSKLESN